MLTRILAVAALALAVVVAGVVIAAGGDEPHRLRAEFDNTINVTEGQEVRIAGRNVGKVARVELNDGVPVVELHITDDAVWPLPRGTRAAIRWGSTTSYVLRFIELLPGPRSAPALADNALLGRGQTRSPVELDQAFRIFRGRTRAHTGALVGRLGDTFDGRGRALSKGLRAAPGGLDGTGALLRELGEDEAALSTLVEAGDRTVGALAARDDRLRSLMVNAAGTMDEFAQHADAQRSSLERLPPTLRASTVTLARLDESLVRLDALVGDLRTGAPELRRLATTARPTLAALRRVAPDATGALQSGTRAAAPLRRLFEAGSAVLPRFGAVLTRLDPMLGCVRPYGPEIASFLTLWSGFLKNYDTQGHYSRAFPLEIVPALAAGTRNSSEDATRQQELRYAMPRPPGLAADKPWLLPQCGAGSEALDAGQDPERPGAAR